MSEIYDTVVVGGGPAGASAASFLKKAGQSVLLLEKSVFPRDKVCGEFISPAAWRILDELGVREKIERSGYHPVEKAVLYAASEKYFEVQFKPQHAFGLSRSRLDDVLLGHARSMGVEVREGTLVASHEKNQDGVWVLRAVSKDSKVAHECRGHRLVLASGRSLPPNQNVRKGLFGFKAHYRDVENLKGALELFFLDVGYGGLVQIEEGLVDACFLLDIKKVPVHWVAKRPDEFMKWIFDRHWVLKNRMGEAVRIGSLLTTGPLLFGLKSPVGAQGIVHVGDSLGMIDPFLGEGVTLALESGLILAQSLQRGEFGKLVRDKFKRRFLLSRSMRSLSHSPVLLNGLIWALSKSKSTSQYLFRLAHGYS